ncbi:serine hydrolase domain-containing protein [Xylocopilactobacillus apis]|uniref:Peptidase S12 n=1 Tax=Xylocopilactobacillus apis TaxID=2932183 RepID=A0AAU9D2D7_9LACO|nr:serine hydrolase domain-containing protein [Xylocopilactobacillus apis]BDR55540.1 peptidase S12 [Xylocopilactobacillus apis]
MKVFRRICLVILLLVVGTVIGLGGSYLYYQRVIQPQEHERYEKKLKDLQDQYEKELKKAQAAKKMREKMGTSSVDLLSANQEAVIENFLKSNHFIGTVLLYKNDRIIFQRGYGYADYQAKKWNNPDSLYQWASLQKSLTAVLIMKCAEEGKLRLDDPLSKYYPSILGSSSITLRQMLDMKSGLKLKRPLSTKDNQDILTFDIENAFVDPDKIGNSEYQSVNYVLLAGILQKVNQENYYEYLKDKIFTPLHVKHFGFNTLSPNSKMNKMVSYRSPLNDLDSYANPVTISPDSFIKELGTGNIYSTAQTLLETQLGILQGKIISKDDLNALRDSADGYYGGGVYNFSDHFFAHGLIVGYESEMYITNDGHNAVIAMSNRSFPAPSFTKAYNFTTDLYQKMMEDFPTE